MGTAVSFAPNAPSPQSQGSHSHEPA
jgi:hypothetical protein